MYISDRIEFCIKLENEMFKLEDFSALRLL